MQLALALALALGPVFAHICILSPPQRGPLSVFMPGDNSCYRRTPFCGGVNQTSPGTTLLAGSTTVIKVQQNLNHFTPSNQGFFVLAVIYNSNPSRWTILDMWDDFPAWDMVSQVNFTRTVQLPAQTGPAILAFEYVSNNPGEIDPPSNKQAIFYNCADIDVVSGGGESKARDSLPEPAFKPRVADAGVIPDDLLPREDAPAPPSPSNSLPTACQAPDVWTAEGVEITESGSFVSHKIVVDQVAKESYWQRVSSDPAIPSLTTITNYTSLLEYVITGPKACDVYGPDPMYAIGFGVGFGMGPAASIGSGGLWGFEGNRLSHAAWVVRQDGAHCLPVSRKVGGSTIQFISKALIIPPAGIFDKPSFCKNPSMARMPGQCGKLN